MNLRAFFRLFWRPSALFWTITLVGVAAPLYVASTQQLVSAGPLRLWVEERPMNPGEQRMHLVEAWTWLLPVLAGFLAGQAATGIQHCPFSWLLPGLRRSLRVSVTGLGVATALGMALLHGLLGGGADLLPVAGASLLGFCMGTALLRRPWPWLSRATLAVLLVVPFFTRELLRFFQQQPLAGVLLAAAGSWYYLGRGFSAGTARASARQADYSLLDLFQPATETALLRLRWQRRGGRDRWRQRPRGGQIVSWLQAAAYESRMGSLAGWIGQLLLCGLGLTWIMAGMRYFGARDPAAGVARIRAALLDTDPMTHLLLAFMAWMFGLLMPLQFQTSWLYPASRQQRARVFYYGSLCLNAVVCVAIVAGYSLAGGLVLWLDGQPPQAQSMPPLPLVLGLVLAAMPLSHWMRLRADPIVRGSTSSVYGVAVVVCVALALGISTAAVWLGAWLSRTPMAMQLASLAFLIALSQWFFYRHLQHYFRHQDLA